MIEMKTITSSLFLALGLLSSQASCVRGCSSLADVACGTTEHGEFSTFCDLMFTHFPSMGLDPKLDGSTWTVFMPTDAAFEAYSEVLDPIFETTSNLFWETDFAGLNIVAYHFHNGDAIALQDLECSGLTTMSNLEESRHKCNGEDERIQKGQGNHDEHGLPLPNIIKSDIEFCNGIIHVIDGVMLPKNFDEASLPAEAAAFSSGDDNDEETGGATDDTTGAMEGDDGSWEKSESEQGCIEPEAVFAVVNKFTIRNDNNCVGDWLEASNKNALGARTSEKGSLRFDVIGVSETEYILYELYTDEIAFFEGHLFTDHFQDWYRVHQRCKVFESSVFPKGYVTNTRLDGGSFFGNFCPQNTGKSTEGDSNTN